jgi:hypothetical protein
VKYALEVFEMLEAFGNDRKEVAVK